MPVFTNSQQVTLVLQSLLLFVNTGMAAHPPNIRRNRLSRGCTLSSYSSRPISP